MRGGMEIIRERDGYRFLDPKGRTARVRRGRTGGMWSWQVFAPDFGRPLTAFHDKVSAFAYASKIMGAAS